MQTLYLILELSPVLMAIVAMIAAGRGYQYAEPGKDRILLLIGMVCSALLILAQVALFISTFVTREPESMFNYVVWAIFNNLVMLMILLYVLPRAKVQDEISTTK